LIVIYLLCGGGSLGHVENRDKFTHFSMQTEKSSTTFMSEIHTRLTPRQGDTPLMQSQSTVVDTSIGPCLLMGALSWLLLFSLYHWLA
jgi:hypothetical protein